jgi:parallel beta-helix repeat protein
MVALLLLISCIAITEHAAGQDFLPAPDFASVSIIGDSGFKDHPAVSGGRGTERNPWIIENLKMEDEFLGIFIMDTRDHFVIRNCEIRSSDSFRAGPGIILNNVTNGKVVGNVIHGNSLGIQVGSSLNITIEDNLITDSKEYGIILGVTRNVIIKGNEIRDSGWGGIKLSYSVQSTVLSCKLEDNWGYGIFMAAVGESKIMGNTMNRNPYGLFLRDSDENGIFGNEIAHNEHGIHLERSWNNTIYNNNFINNTQHAFEEYRNSWYNTSLESGNYWDDHTGTGPYPISGNSSADQYPSAMPFELYYEDSSANLIPVIAVLAVAVALVVTVVLLRRRDRKKMG